MPVMLVMLPSNHYTIFTKLLFLNPNLKLGNHTLDVTFQELQNFSTKIIDMLKISTLTAQ